MSVGQTAMGLAGRTSVEAGTVEIAQGEAAMIVDGSVLVVEEGLDEGGVCVEHGLTSRVTSE
jgi:hypothetical protein